MNVCWVFSRLLHAFVFVGFGEEEPDDDDDDDDDFGDEDANRDVVHRGSPVAQPPAIGSSSSSSIKAHTISLGEGSFS